MGINGCTWKSKETPKKLHTWCTYTKYPHIKKKWNLSFAFIQLSVRHCWKKRTMEFNQVKQYEEEEKNQRKSNWKVIFTENLIADIEKITKLKRIK